MVVSTPGSVDVVSDESRTGRPRNPATDSRLHEATLQVLRERGPSGVTIEAVSHASGVAKTTIYRRHANADELLAAALEQLTVTAPDLGIDDPRDRLVAGLEAFQSGLERGIGVLAFATLLTEPESAFSRLCRSKLLTPRLTILTDIVAELQNMGRIRSEVSAETTVLLMAGSYFTASATQGGPPQHWAREAVQAFWKHEPTP